MTTRREGLVQRFSPNISLLFTEYPLADRFCAARDCGFTAVEFWPWEDQSIIKKQVSATGLAVSILNVNPGPEGSHGELANPEATDWWRSELMAATNFARDVGCTTVNALTGNRMGKYPLDRQLDTAAANLAAGLEAIEGSGIDLVLEPLGPDRPTYLTRRVSDVVALREAAGNPDSLGLLFDVYHLYQTELREISEIFCETKNIVKHVQIADVPGRHQPGTGDIDWTACRRAVESSGYGGWIGLEFIPVGHDTASAIEDALTAWGS
ncbi:TIM barrel protein [Mycobacterium sp. AT1]|uniref:TIM barrel protein n=1 Tax=Mycobacterium sp. AT1 TaxID=1961706 RepID=UPI0009AECDF3|nr:TIM barrel protein [Mycobacterium sp. AT1]OPX13287.1 hypothetical protein B1790_01085 [Mycobacterium sp. AT1]